MNVTIRQLQVFTAVAASRSFAEACETVNLSQPALSISIRKLEESVGGKLFARSTRSVALTPEGEAFFPVARRLLADWDRALEDVHNLFALQRGKLDIAAMPTFTSSLLPGILNNFHSLHPAINVTVHDVVAEQVVEMVRAGRVELGVSFDPGEVMGLQFQALFSDRFVAVLPGEHPLLALERTLRWADLQKYSYIALQRPSSIRLLIDSELQKRGLSLTPAFEAHQLVSIGRMVAEHLGVSVVPTLSAPQMHDMGAQTRPISGPLITRQVGVLTRRRAPRSVAAQAMLEIVLQCSGPVKQPGR
jgi:LysR family carnitine catabolism transcriptional activator